MNLTDIGPEVLRMNPSIIQTLRMCTCPPLARDRLINLADVPKSVVERMERKGKLPVHLTDAKLNEKLSRIGSLILKMADRDIFTWLDAGKNPTDAEIQLAATIIADRLCGAMTDPIIRNEQEKRQLRVVSEWLRARGYQHLSAGDKVEFNKMPPGSYMIHLNVPGKQENGGAVKVPVDVVIMRKRANRGDHPLLVETKSAGDFTNVNKRRKEEADKFRNLRRALGQELEYVLFLCGFFPVTYLSYEAAERIDWIWEHRIDDFCELGV
jgi:hypothetical protein